MSLCEGFTLLRSEDNKRGICGDPGQEQPPRSRSEHPLHSLSNSTATLPPSRPTSSNTPPAYAIDHPRTRPAIRRLAVSACPTSAAQPAPNPHLSGQTSSPTPDQRGRCPAAVSSATLRLCLDTFGSFRCVFLPTSFAFTSYTRPRHFLKSFLYKRAQQPAEVASESLRSSSQRFTSPRAPQSSQQTTLSSEPLIHRRVLADPSPQRIHRRHPSFGRSTSRSSSRSATVSSDIAASRKYFYLYGALD